MAGGRRLTTKVLNNLPNIIKGKSKGTEGKCSKLVIADEIRGQLGVEGSERERGGSSLGFHLPQRNFCVMDVQ